MFEIVDGRTPEHGYTISSPCEPNGSGELKKVQQDWLVCEPRYEKTGLLHMQKQRSRSAAQ